MKDFIYDEVKSGLAEIRYQVEDIRLNIKVWFLGQRPFDDTIAEEAELAQGFATERELKALYDGLQTIKLSLAALWTPALEELYQEDRKEIERQEDMQDGRSY